MAAKAVLTDRQLKNQMTGIDIYVAGCQEVPQKSSSNTLNYQVIVVTSLFYYKTKIHKESDVVQFMITKSFEEFEELYKKLSGRFPSVVFPILPKQSVLLRQTSSDERQRVMNEVLQMVARTQKLCCSPMVIEFLKGLTKKSAPAVVEEEITVDEQTTTESAPPGQFEDVDLFEAPPQTPFVRLSDDEDVLTAHQDLRASTVVTAAPISSSIFDDETTEAADTDSDLFTPSRRPITDESAESAVLSNDFEDDLLEVEEEGNDLLALTQSSQRRQSIQTKKPDLPAKPSLPPKPSSLANTNKPKKSQEIFGKSRKGTSIRKTEIGEDNLDDIFGKKKGSSIFDDDEDDEDLFSSNNNKNQGVKIDAMGHDDITAYLQKNTISS